MANLTPISQQPAAILIRHLKLVSSLCKLGWFSSCTDCACYQLWACKNDLVDVWNVSDLVDVEEEKMKLFDCTSNGLESYNKVFNAICPDKHPNLDDFVDALCKEVDHVI